MQSSSCPLLRKPYPKIRLDEDTHIYRVQFAEGASEVVVPSVTQIISPYLYNYPTTADSIRAMSLGKSVHKVTLDWETSTEPILMPTEITGYLEAWKSYVRDTRTLIVLREATVADASLRFAGTLDRVGFLTTRNRPAIIDIKTGSGPIKAAYAQAAGYRIGLEATYEGECSGWPPGSFALAVVRLSASGKYREFVANLTEDAEAIARFRACHHISEYRREQGWTT